MPNYCAHELAITGPHETLRQFKNQAEKFQEGITGTCLIAFSMNQFLPTSKEIEYSYSTLTHEETNKLIYRYRTASHPLPGTGFRRLSHLFPDLTFALSFADITLRYYAHQIHHAGEIVSDLSGTIHPSYDIDEGGNLKLHEYLDNNNKPLNNTFQELARDSS